MEEKIILATFYGDHISMLIPKKRGAGFQKSPVYHSSTPLTRFIADLGYDCCGLEGALDIINAGYIWHDNKDKFEREIIQPIAEFLGYPYKILDVDEYHLAHCKHMGFKRSPTQKV